MRWPFIRPIVLKLEITMTTTAEAQAIVAAIQALPAQFAAAEAAQITAATADLQSKLDAADAALAQERQDHADDLAALQTAVAGATPAPTGPSAS
jgi:hypothetical protein